MHDAKFWREKLLPYTKKSNLIATRQVLLTLIPFALLWGMYSVLVKVSLWFFIPFAIIISLFILRIFVLMHDCGHYSMFSSKRLNEFVGFSLGVLTGMPQFVWSKNHAYHHKTNGDWVKYGGVFNILNTDQYTALSAKGKAKYWMFRQPAILIPAGFFYVLFFPRVNWLIGNLVMLYRLVLPLVCFNFSEVKSRAQKWETKYWKGKKDYLHMTYNNVTLILIWIAMSNLIGVSEFFLLYVASTSLSGSLGILTFTVQHNFENSYATDTQRVDRYRAALEGTSMLVLPPVLNWFTSDIAYHHLHHLSEAIPNYRLAACHKEWSHLFEGVKRIYLRDLFSTFQYQLWDSKIEKVVPKMEPQV